MDGDCPPLCSLLHLTLHDEYEGVQLEESKLRAMFSRESLLGSDWYRAHLEVKREIDGSLARRTYARWNPLSEHNHLNSTGSEDYLQKLKGTLGVPPLAC